MIDWSSIASLVDLLASIAGTKGLNLECRTFSYNQTSVNHHQIHLCVFRSISDFSGVDGDIPALAPLLPCVLASFNFDTSVLSQWSSEVKLNWIEKDWQANENTHNLQKYWLSGYSYVYRKKAFCLHLIDNKVPVLLSVHFYDDFTIVQTKSELTSDNSWRSGENEIEKAWRVDWTCACSGLSWASVWWKQQKPKMIGFQ